MATLSNAGKGKENTWDFGDGQSTKGDNVVHVFKEPGTYKVTLTTKNANGKTSTDVLEMIVTGAAPTPIIISPNGDGKSDEFNPTLKNIMEVETTIFDAKGNIVYQWTDLKGKWEGKDQHGEKVNDGEYIYVIKTKDGVGNKREHKGYITLKR